MDFLKSCLHSLPGSDNTAQLHHQALPAYFCKDLKLFKLHNTLYTLNGCELYLGTNLLSRYKKGKSEEKRLHGFLS